MQEKTVYSSSSAANKMDYIHTKEERKIKWNGQIIASVKALSKMHRQLERKHDWKTPIWNGKTEEETPCFSLLLVQSQQILCFIAIIWLLLLSDFHGH